jgi:diphosphomevalonate decarboxylase
MDAEEFKKRGESLKEQLIEYANFNEIQYTEPELEDFKESTSMAYPIKAFEKFLGFYDKTEKIAYNPSISFNTDFSFCISSCRYTREEGKDSVNLDGIQNTSYTSKASKALTYFKSRFSIKGSFQFRVKRFRRYENAKGMSESSAVAASVSRSLISNVFPNHPDQDLLASRFARLVSGSGTRACINGLSLWLSYPGINPDQSFAFKIKDNPMQFYYGIFPKKQSVKTDLAHEFAVRSTFYRSWIQDKYTALELALKSGFDENYLLKRGQQDSLNLHSVLLSSGLMVQTPESIKLISEILEFQKNNEGIFLNADTGPSIMIGSKEKSLIKEFQESRSDQFLHGSFNFPNQYKELNNFKKESTEYFSKL